MSLSPLGAALPVRPRSARSALVAWRLARALLPPTLLVASCASQRRLLAPPGSVELLVVDDAPALVEPPDFVRESPDEWVLLTSGEWLRGEVDALVRSTLEFDSEELDELKLDWDKVLELHTKRSFTVLLENRSSVTGALDVVGDVVRVTRAPAAGGEPSVLTFRRDDVQRIVRGALSERDHWTGKVRLGLTARRGNTQQTDAFLGASATRRTAATRLALSLDTLLSEQSGTEVANSQRFDGGLDYFLTSRMFLAPIGLELFSDRFQNIALRATPRTGLGYTFADVARLEWWGTMGVGYRWTRYDSVPPDQDSESSVGVGIVETEIDSDLTEKLELAAKYSVQLAFEDLGQTQHHAKVELSYDMWEDLDVSVSFLWDRVGMPEPDAGGETPARDDFRIDVGLAWSF